MNRVVVKFCGMIRDEDIVEAARLGVDAVGFNFWPNSPRAVTPADAAHMARLLPPFTARVGVFVDEPVERILGIAARVGLTAVQLHGDEPPGICEALRPLRVYKALRVGPDFNDDLLTAYPCDAFLLDGFSEAAPGGTGVRFDWSRARKLSRRARIIVAGGLDPGNVEAAISEVHPYAVDVASGIESAPGVKDPTLMEAFVRAARRAERSGSSLSLDLADDAAAPDARGRFGEYGGRYVSETLMAPLEELASAFDVALTDPLFRDELHTLLATYAGRPTPLYRAECLTREWGGATVYLKREDLLHTGAHKLNNALGQALLARSMGKHRLLAETGAGQHGVAAATAGARLGLETVVYMGEEDCARQALNVYRMRLLGADVVTVTTGSRTLKDAINEAMRDWVTHVETSAYCLGSVLGPHPYPKMVREFQTVIGRETREQILEAEGRLPDLLVACVGGGSNSIGLFHPFVDDATVDMVGVEAGGRGSGPGEHAARFSGGTRGVLHGAFTWILQDEAGNIQPTHSVSAGLDYPAVGPEHAWLRDRGRATYDSVDDAQALAAFHELAAHEGILCALETAHAVAWAKDAAGELGPGKILVINLSGRGDKDVPTLARNEGIE